MIGWTDSWGLDKEVAVSGPAPAKFSIASPGINGSFSVASGSQAPLLGIFQFATNADQPQCRLRLQGISFCMAGAPIAEGDFITSDTDGNGIPAEDAGDASITLYVIGVALAPVITRQPCPVLVNPQFIPKP